MTTATSSAVPALNHGERLSREEFERRYEAMPGVKKAELIDGVVHMPSPVLFGGHGEPHFHLLGWMFHYRAYTPGVRLGDNSTVRLDLDSEPQPDGIMLIDPACRGRTSLTDDYVTGGPELAAEVAASSLPLDRGAKFRLYRRNGVREYLLWDVRGGAVEWFALSEGRYDPIAPGPDGVLRSVVFPGLRLDVRALLVGDLLRLLAVLDAGIASPEHAAFVASLRPAG